MLGMGCFSFESCSDRFSLQGWSDSYLFQNAGTCEDAESNTFFDGGITDFVQPNVFTYGPLVVGLCIAHKVVKARV